MEAPGSSSLSNEQLLPNLISSYDATGQSRILDPSWVEGIWVHPAIWCNIKVTKDSRLKQTINPSPKWI